MASKLTRPQPPAECVDRPRLYQQLARWEAQRAIVIHAAAGYGKSTLVSRWLELSGNASRTAWLALDSTDSDPTQFVRYVAAALEQVAPGMLARVQPILTDNQSHPQRALTQLFAALRARLTVNDNGDPRHLLLVLEDVHVLCSPAVDALIMTMLERGPANLHLVLLTRQATSLPLARLCASGQLLELTADDLRFTAAEVAQYLVSHRYPQPTAEELTLVLARTEGWVAALQLATLSRRTHGTLAELLGALRGDKHWLAQYLSNELLARQTPTMQRFLIQTSILDSFRAPLCAAVTGVADAHRLLAAAEQAGLFLIPLDGSHEWFRYHHLFQELLQQRLLEDEGEEVASELHRRAARWLAAADRLADAIHHLQAAGDDDAAAALVEGRLHTLLLQDPYQSRRLIEQLPQTVLQRRPQLMLDRCRVAILFNSEQAGTRVQEAIDSLRQVQPTGPNVAAWQAELLVHRAFLHFRQGEALAAIELAVAAQRDADKLDDFMVGTLEFMLMHLHRQLGQFDAAQQHAHHALAAFTAAHFLPGAIALRRELAQWSMRAGYGDEASLQFEAIFTVQDRDGPMVVRELLFAYFYAAENSYWLNHLEQALAYQREGMALAEQLQDEEIILGLTCLGELCAIAGAQPPAPLSGTSALPPHLTVQFPPVFADVQARLLVASGRGEAAWGVPKGFGLTLRDAPTKWPCAVLMPFLRAYIARGQKLASVTAVLSEALAHHGLIEDRLGQLQLLALTAWQELQVGDLDAATQSVLQANTLAEQTGYVRVLLELPQLAPLLATIATPVQPARTALPTAAHMGGSELTSQEQAVLAQLAMDHSYAQIAAELVISINTVRTHVRHIYRKLGVHRRSQALRRAQSLGLRSTPP